jgi:hypothetical protein
MVVTAVTVLQAWRAWRARGCSLVVESSGRIAYRDDEISPPAPLRRVLLEVREDSDGFTTYYLSVVRADGSVVGLPAPYFNELDDHASTVWLAARLAVTLGVPVETA